MTGWLRRGAAAASLASERGDLWPPAMLASFVYVGWLPLLLVVAPPSGSDLEYFGVSLITSGAYPANVIALSTAAVAGFVLLVILAAFSEVALIGLIRRSPVGEASRSAVSGAAVMLVALVPVIIACALLVMAIIAAAPGVYVSPDVATPVLLRLAAAVLPYLIGVALAILIGQVFGGLALRAAIASNGEATLGAIRSAFGRLARAPLGPIGVAVVGWLKDLLLLAGSYALLGAVWGPVDDRLGGGPLARPETIPLLVGFVAIWLGLLMVGGALHAFVSAWWLAELSPDRAPLADEQSPAGQPDPMRGQR